MTQGNVLGGIEARERLLCSTLLRQLFGINKVDQCGQRKDEAVLLLKAVAQLKDRLNYLTPLLLWKHSVIEFKVWIVLGVDSATIALVNGIATVGDGLKRQVNHCVINQFSHRDGGTNGLRPLLRAKTDPQTE
jgi:hypothetical protein